MFCSLALLAIGLSAVAAGPLGQSQRIVGGEDATIEQHPHQVSILSTWDFEIYRHGCGGSILNTRTVLTAAHCFVFGLDPLRHRVRVGSSSHSEGGSVHFVRTSIAHPDYDYIPFMNHDIGIFRVDTPFVFSSRVQPIMIAGPNYVVPDGAEVWASGWGDLWFNGPDPEILQHVQIWTVNQEICRTRYEELPGNMVVTDTMICAGYLDVGGRDQCQGDSGGPLTHNGVLVGVTSFGEECAHPRYPGVNARVSSYTAWIQANA